MSEMEEGDIRAWRHAMSQMGPMLSEDDQIGIRDAAIRGRRGRLTEEAMSKMLDWAEAVRTHDAILSNVLNGDFLIVVNAEGEVAFSLSDKGKAEVRKMAGPLGLPMPDDDNG